jgi:hypothetical protein
MAKLAKAARDVPDLLGAALLFTLSSALFRLPPRCGLGGLTRSAMKAGPGVVQIEKAQAVERRVAIVERNWPAHLSCLHRSLVLVWLLRCHNVQASLRLGVRKSPAGLTAHAWVMLGGQPLNDSVEHCETFVPLEASQDSWALLPEARAAL